MPLFATQAAVVALEAVLGLALRLRWDSAVRTNLQYCQDARHVAQRF